MDFDHVNGTITGFIIGTDVQAYDANTVKTTGAQTLASKTLTAPITTGEVDIQGTIVNSVTGSIELNDSTDITGTLEVSSWCEINGAASQAATLGVTYDSDVDTDFCLALEDKAPGAVAGPEISIYRNSASPAAWDYMGVLWFDGESSTGALRTYASIALRAAQVTNASEWGQLKIYTKVAGTNTLNSTFYRAFICGAPTGSHNATGTVWAQDVYDDNTLLTCYVFDQQIDGAIDNTKWDGKVPDRITEEEPARKERKDKAGNVISPAEPATPAIPEPRQHDPMRQFKARIGGQYDPLNIDKYSQHWKDKKHLTSMPNEDKYDPDGDSMSTGQWIQRLLETVEIQAIHIDNLNTRLKALENV